MTQWIVRGHWDGRVNRIHGDSYATREAALADIAKLVGNGLVSVEVDGDAISNEIVYPDQEAADSDEGGMCPTAACATLEERADDWSPEA